MEKYSGKGVYKGVAMGKAMVFSKAEDSVKRVKTNNVNNEIKRFEEACDEAKKQLTKLYEKAVTEVGEACAAIFEVHQMLLEDEDFAESVREIIRGEEVNAEYAVAVTGDNFSGVFAGMDDEYMQARAADIKDISNRLVRILYGRETSLLQTDEPIIIVAEDLTPGETVQIDKEKILAFVTVKGSINSHTAILARMMNIPAVVNVNIKIEKIKNGCPVIVDGEKGQVIIEPDEENILKAKQRINIEKENRILLNEMKGKQTVTKCGRHIKLYANIGNVNDLAYVLENDAAGIGLFRSEFLYIGKDNYPTEEEQFAVYKQVLQTMAGKKVIVRTLDIGADKQADYFNIEKEENPAMGYRAIRICLSEPKIFKTQLRALYRASKYGNLSIMYPMIISTEEVKKIKGIVNEVKAELDEHGVPYSNVEQGIMIETPAAVMISDELAKYVDFFSVGTNDLTQYTLAIDRQNSKLDDYYNPHHEAVLKMIKMAADNAHKEGKWIGICGELAADTQLTETFVNMGIDELSVSPSMILPIRKIIREI